jgi:apolipoprotein N-acyltransferase
MTTAWGQVKGRDDVLQRIADIGSTAAASPGKGDTLVWPESVLGRYDSALLPVLDLEVLSDASRRRRQHVIGMDIEVAPGKWHSQAVAFHPDGSTAFGTARQPAPLALWRPWAASSFVADWTANNVLNLGASKRVAVIFCYEEYMPILYLVNEAFDRPSGYVAMSNTWAAGDAAADVVQAQHSRGIAMLFGRPYARSVNRPAS